MSAKTWFGIAFFVIFIIICGVACAESGSSRSYSSSSYSSSSSSGSSSISASDYIRQADPDLYNSMTERYNSLK